MKTIVLISGVLALSFSMIQNKASSSQMTTFKPVQVRNIQEERIKIKKEELPETARKTLEGVAFKDWTINNAYKLKSGDYEVELKKGETIQSLKFDKNGEIK